MMKVKKDFAELLELFNKHKVRYCIIGSFAVGFHAIPRYTKVMDILVDSNAENAKRILAALDEFGFGNLGLTVDDLSKSNGIIQLGHEPVRIDLLTSVSGCKFEEIWKNRRRGIYGQEKVSFAGLDQVIKMKKASNRYQDKADLEKLLKSKSLCAKRRRR